MIFSGVDLRKGGKRILAKKHEMMYLMSDEMIFMR